MGAFVFGEAEGLHHALVDGGGEAGLDGVEMVAAPVNEDHGGILRGAEGAVKDGGSNTAFRGNCSGPCATRQIDHDPKRVTLR